MILREKGRFVPNPKSVCVEAAIQRFLKFCRFEPETGCVVWTGGQTQGRGHHVPYGSFWFTRRWFAHRFAAKFIHGLDIEGFQVDHCCSTIPKPNTLCVQHLQAVTAGQNRQLQETRKTYIHLQVGLLSYEDVFGPHAERSDEDYDVPFYDTPDWMKPTKEIYDATACPF